MTTVNKGKTSPRFAFMERFTIPSRNTPERDYLYRLRIIDTPWFGLYVHVITGPDEDPHLHNHPATFRALILSGEYTDEWKAGIKHISLFQTHKRFSINKIMYGEFHKIIRADAPVWTLVFRGRRRSSWGFLVNGEVIDYTEYLDPSKYGSW